MAAASTGEEKFSYALVSAAPLQDTTTTGIGIIFKAPDRSTIKTICQALEHTDTTAALYEAVMRVLDEALATGVGRPAIYVDDPQVVAQLNGEQPAPRELLATNLRTRAVMNQVGRTRVMAATASPRFSARRLATSARGGAPRQHETHGRQLSLLPDDAAV